MRATTVLSLLLALALAGLAVIGARAWLTTERENIASQLLRNAPVEEEAPRNTIVVAASQLQFGERLTRDKLKVIDWAADEIPAGSFASIDMLVSDEDENARFVVSSMDVGEPVFVSKITEPGQRAKLSTALTPGMKAISIRVNDVLGVAGFVLPGDRVDIMLTRNAGAQAFVDVLLQGVRVLAIDQIADDRKDQPSVVRTVTFEVSTPEAQKLALASQVGTLSLALRNIASADVEEVERVTVLDLADLDISDELLDDKAEDTVAAPTMEEVSAAQQAQMEELLKGFMTELSGRIDEVETSINESNEVIIQPEVATNAAPEVEEPKAPTTTYMSVTRGGRTQEYRVFQNLLELVEGS